MNYWFIIHDLLAYEQHSDMIGCTVRSPGEKKPKFSQFAEIRIGDKIVYYATKDYVIVGLFDVVSDMGYVASDQAWGEDVVYKIRPFRLPPEGYYLDFKQLLKKESFQLSIFPDKKKWAMYLQGKTCRPLSKEDFDLIADNLNNEELLKDRTEIVVRPTTWHKRLERKKAPEPKEKFSHDDLLEALITIGEVFGFGTTKKPSINEIRPSQDPFKAKGKVLDLAWRLFDLTWIPFEIQRKGSVPDLMYRFNLVHQWSLKLIVVADQHFHEELREAARSYPFKEKIVLISPEEVGNATDDVIMLKKLREKIFA